MTRKLLGAIVLAGMLTAASGARALVKFDFEQKYFAEFGPEVKDHSLLRVDGVYHLFYLRGDPAVDIGHATSPDLIHWTLEAPVLSIEPGTWDDLAMWAPQVLPDGRGNWLMYYTGVNTYWSQQTGIALSPDLYTWMKVPWPVYHPDPSWAEWTETAWSHGRDPFVLEHGGLFYMLNTAKTWANEGAVSCAVSSDRYNWQDIGPLYRHTTWHVLESIQCIERNGKFHMFFTEEGVFGTSHIASDSLMGGWNFDNRALIDLGHAPEINEFDAGKYVFSRHAVHNYGNGTIQYVIRFDSLRWAGDIPFVYKTWPLAGDWTVVSGTAFAFQPTFLNNPAVRGVNVDIGYEGLSWLSSHERYQGPLGIGSPGGFQGDFPVGIIRSRTFAITGNSINLLVGGADDLANCYVALVDASTQQVLFRETGKNSDEMDRRYWDVVDIKGTDVYIEIADQSGAPFGHISADDITESLQILNNDVTGSGDGRGTGLAGAPTGATHPTLALFQNSPNPFNPVTAISYRLPGTGDVVLDVFDVQGARVRRLVSGREDAGAHSTRWDGRNQNGRPLPSGIYFYRLRFNGKTAATKKMMLLK